MIQFHDIMKTINVDCTIISSYRSLLVFLEDLQKLNEVVNAEPGICLRTVPDSLSKPISENGKEHLAELAQLLMEERNFGRPFDALHVKVSSMESIVL